MASLTTRKIEHFLATIDVLIVDDNTYTRKIVRTLLFGFGVKTVREAGDGISGLELLRHYGPDVLIVDSEMPILSGTEMVRMIRKPQSFALCDIPIIMMSGHLERWRILEAQRAGVHEFLAKPISGRALFDRLTAIFASPRPFIQKDGYYGPEPREIRGSWR